MKKIILTVVTTLFVAGAAQAQSPRVEVMMTSPALNGTGTRQSRPAARPQANVQQQQNQVLRAVLQQVVAKAKQQNQPVNAADSTKPTAKKAAKKAVAPTKTQEGSVEQWLKAIFWGGRFPGESTQQYHDRMVAQSQPAALPFK